LGIAEECKATTDYEIIEDYIFKAEGEKRMILSIISEYWGKKQFGRYLLLKLVTRYIVQQNI
jgi:hypothetical protein